MLVVLTSEQEIHHEAMLLNQLFKAGLKVLHLRKPRFDIAAYRNLLNKINPEYYTQIMIHEHHNLCAEFGLKGIHIQEQARLNLGCELQNYINDFKEYGHLVSSSFHEPEVLESCNATFDYHLLSPVFSSISKQGYKGRGFDVNHIDKIIVGMGGINSETIQKTITLGYQGIGVLGGIWNTENPVNSFQLIMSNYQLNRNNR